MLLLGHRGAPHEALENTLESFAAAFDGGADGVETDVRALADGKLVLFHDADLSRVASRPERVRDLTWSAARRTALIGGHRIPTLDDLLDLAAARARGAGRALLLDLELKDYDVAAPVVATLERHDLARVGIVVTCFAARPVAEIAARSGPWAPGLLDRGRRPRPVAAARGCGARWLAACRGSDGALRRARRAGLATLVWTVDEPQEALRYRAMGVDALCTNAPRMLGRALR